MSQKTKLLNIRSFDRISGTNSKFVADIGSHGIDGRITRVVVKSVYFTNSQYNIKTSKNETTITVTFAGPVVVNAVIADGQYTITQLLSVIKTSLQAAMISAGVTGVINLVDNIYQNTVTITNTLTNIVSVSADKLGEILGFTTTQVQVPALSQTGEHIYDLTGLRIVHIGINKLSSNHLVTSDQSMRNIIVDIPCNVPFGSQAYYAGSDDVLNSITFPSPLNNIRLLEMEILDESFSPIEFNGFPWSVVLKVYY